MKRKSSGLTVELVKQRQVIINGIRSNNIATLADEPIAVWAATKEKISKGYKASKEELAGLSEQIKSSQIALAMWSGAHSFTIWINHLDQIVDDKMDELLQASREIKSSMT